MDAEVIEGEVVRVEHGAAGAALVLLAPASVPNVLALLLADNRSEQTNRAYAADLCTFFRSGQSDPAPQTVAAFLALSAPQVAATSPPTKRACSRWVRLPECIQ